MLRLPDTGPITPSVSAETPGVLASPVKLPACVLGDRPAIKLFVATVQVGVGSNELLPGFWKSPVTTRAAEAELAKVSRAKQARLAAILDRKSTRLNSSHR